MVASIEALWIGCYERCITPRKRGLETGVLSVISVRRMLPLLAFALTAGPGIVHADSLVDELRGLTESNPQIQAKQKASLSSEEAIRAARAGYLPTAKVTGDSGPEWVDNPTRNTTNAYEPYYRGRESAGLTITQHLFDGWLTDASVEAAKRSFGISGTDLQATRQNVVLEGIQAYLNVLKNAKLIQLSRQSERNVQEQLSLEDERVQKGAGIASDVLAAKQRLQIAKQKRVRYEGDFQHDGVARYTQLFGHAPNVAALADPALPLSMLPATLEEALAIAEQENPSLQTASLSIEKSGEDKRIAEAGYYPTLDLIGKADYENDKNIVVGVRRDWSLLLTANWELFSGFKTDAQVAQASYNYAAAKDNQLYAGRKVAEIVRQAWSKLQTARQSVALLENAAVLAEEVWTARKKQREAGKATVQEVLDEETRIYDARIDYTSAYYDQLNYAFTLLAAMGRLDVDSVASQPAQPPAAPTPGTGKLRDLTTPLSGRVNLGDQISLQDMATTAADTAAGPGLVGRRR